MVVVAGASAGTERKSMTGMRSFSVKKALLIAAIAGLAYGVGSRSRSRDDDRFLTPRE